MTKQILITYRIRIPWVLLWVLLLPLLVVSAFSIDSLSFVFVNNDVQNVRTHMIINYEEECYVWTVY